MNKYLDYIFDGANGTYFSHLKQTDQAIELFNLSDANTIIELHREYINVGVNAIKTNTFRLNSSLVKDKGYRDLLIKKAVENARKAVANSKVHIFANIGPINISEDNKDEYLEIVKVFENEGVKNFLFETNVEYDSLKPTVQYIKKYIKDSKVIVSFGCNQDGYTQLGYYYLNLFEQANADVDYVGLNCICGPVHMYELAKKVDTSKYNLSLMPNAGYPSINHTPMFEHNPEYFASMLVKFAALDVKILGGCCGSTPEHIRQSIEEINNTKIEYIKPKIEEEKIIKTTSKIKEIFSSGRKLIATEIEPPKTVDTTYLLESAYQLKEKGADLLTLVDSPLGKTRADSLMMAAKVKNEIGLDVLPHLTCRDKNQIALKGGLLGANIFDVNNVLAISGDAIAQIDRETNKGVFYFNSINLINYISELNRDIFNENPYYIAAALNINAINFDAELRRAQKKIDHGAHYFITQSAFSEEAMDNIKKAKEVLKVPVVVGLYPVASYRNALFLNNEVKGISIPEDFINLLAETNKEDYQKVSVNFACKLIDYIYDYCDGFYISTPLKKTSYVLDIVDYIKRKES